MALTLTVPKEYGYVLMTATASTLVGLWQGGYVGSTRKAAKVPYPNAYAPWQEAKEDRAKYVFNCAQRAHANFLEHQPQFLIPLLISGLRYPVASAVLGLAWCVARVMYAVGYVTGKAEGGKGRYVGIWFYLAELGLIGMAGWTGLNMAMA